MNIIDVKNMSFGYKHNLIFEDFSIAFEKGQVYSVIGHNGAGKTTLLRLLLGILKPHNGTIDTIDVVFSYLPDAGGLYEDLTVKQNIEIFYELQVGKKIEKSIIKENLKKWDLTKKENTKAKHLSMGQKRRLSLIITTFQDFDVLLLDEPTNGIDITSQKALNNYLVEQKEKGKTIILSSHDLKLVEEISDKLIIVNDGKIVYQGDVQGLSDLSELYISYTDDKEVDDEEC